MKINSIMHKLFFVVILLIANTCQASERAWIKDYRLGDMQPSSFNGHLCSKIVIDLPKEAQSLQSEVDDFRKSGFHTCSLKKKDTFAGREVRSGELSFIRNHLAYLSFYIPRNSEEKDNFRFRETKYLTSSTVTVDPFSNDIILQLNSRFNSVCNLSPVIVREQRTFKKIGNITMIRWECIWFIDTDQVKLTGYRDALNIELVSKEYEDVMAKLSSIRNRISSIVTEVNKKIQEEKKAPIEAAKKASISKDI